MSEEPKFGDMRVWWIPQVPMKAFYVPVSSIKEAKKILDVLGKYDAFQFENNVKPDYSNVGGLEIYEHNFDGEIDGWCEWYDDDGDGIDETVIE